MNRKNISLICNIISLILVIVFAVKTAVDYSKYDSLVNSAPFSVWIMINAIYFIIPAFIIFIAGCIIGKKKSV